MQVPSGDMLDGDSVVRKLNAHNRIAIFGNADCCECCAAWIFSSQVEPFSAPLGTVTGSLRRGSGGIPGACRWKPPWLLVRQMAKREAGDFA
jgi:hypothetical protein